MKHVNVIQYVCRECKKTAPMNWIMCSTCGDYNGVTEMPEGWKRWPQSTSAHSWPAPVICAECLDEEKYEKELLETRKRDDFGRCPECHSRK